MLSVTGTDFSSRAVRKISAVFRTLIDDGPGGPRVGLGSPGPVTGPAHDNGPMTVLVCGSDSGVEA